MSFQNAGFGCRQFINTAVPSGEKKKVCLYLHEHIREAYNLADICHFFWLSLHIPSDINQTPAFH